MAIVSDLQARDMCYDIIKSAAGEWVNLDELCAKIKRDRQTIARIMQSIRKSKRTPGIESVSKKSTGKMTFGSQKSIYDIKYRYIGE